MAKEQLCPNDASAGDQGQLRRVLGFRDLIVYGLAYIAPFAPLGTLGFVWQTADGLIMLAYLLAGLGMYFTAQSYAIMTGTLPSAGSLYGAARYCLGPLAGFLSGWVILLDYLLIPAFLYVLMSVALAQIVPAIDRSIWIIALVVVTLAINWFGVSLSSQVNTLSVVVQVAVVFILLAAALVALYAGHGSGGLNLRPLYEPHAFKAGHVFTATAICIVSFLGFDAISTLAEEVRGDSKLLIGRAIITVLLLSTGFFVLVSWVLGNLMEGFALKDPANAVYEISGQAIGAWAPAMIAWTYAFIVGFTNALPMQVGVSRVLFAMGRDGELPRLLARIHPTYGTPYVAMLLTSAVSLAVALLMSHEVDTLASIVSFGALVGFALLHVSIIRHFFFRLKSGQRIQHLVLPLCGIAVIAAMVINLSPLARIVGGAWLMLGLAYALILRRRKGGLSVAAL